MKRQTGIGRRVRAARQAAGMTQDELGDAIDSSQGVVQKVENGFSTRPRKLYEMARALRVPVEWLAFGVCSEAMSGEEHDISHARDVGFDEREL